MRLLWSKIPAKSDGGPGGHFKKFYDEVVENIHESVLHFTELKTKFDRVLFRRLRKDPKIIELAAFEPLLLHQGLKTAVSVTKLGPEILFRSNIFLSDGISKTAPPV